METKLILAVCLTIAIARQTSEAITVTKAMEMYEDYEVENSRGEDTRNEQDSKGEVGDGEGLLGTDVILSETPIIVPQEPHPVDPFSGVEYVSELTIDAKKELEHRKHQSLGEKTQFIRGRRYEPPAIFEDSVVKSEAVMTIAPDESSWSDTNGFVRPDFQDDSEYLTGVEAIAMLAGQITDILQAGNTAVGSFLQG